MSRSRHHCGWLTEAPDRYCAGCGEALFTRLSFDETRTRIDPYTRQLFLRRLQRLALMRLTDNPPLTAAGIKLLDRAIAATVHDCQWCGAAGAAAELLKRLEGVR